jgi:hypothetical protein
LKTGRNENERKTRRRKNNAGGAMTHAIANKPERPWQTVQGGEWRAAWKSTAAAALGWAAGGVLLTNVSSVMK